MARFTGERRALAAAVLAFYAFIFFIISMAPPPGWGACFGALAGVYALGFFALVAGYFWARWFAVGIGISGFISAAFSVYQIGPEPVLVFWGGTHLIGSLLLWGKSMASVFDGRPEWREHFHMDESATNRLGKAVMRAGVSMPYMVMYALAPREGAADLVVLAGAGLAIGGLWALIRMRTWGVFALGGGAVLLGTTLNTWLSSGASGTGSCVGASSSSLAGVDVTAFGVAATLLLVAAVTPFMGPMTRYLRR